ncbi:MAG: sigma 54-interacting transcriptional regulator [candidate division KSB1 bacterium]|nr:sigma 54-interacting transcriptional regulator [candidate division KSB1 bacterium]MDZ7276587.1 sigma 54-interacting transcriptional regulator [candidate division KSB1 bacterium]MDZ7288240.1 sigma 54-interacting transcriptional regulator [candidate division KSB1 bacterium]MDZ7300369.1 sigma 54-interacting transcriptional regulator [candidate division KSB1 bacterium]MDZ7309240.1 sigma 54-interacting transcriptional regulator [candidate division KSB1 bacterium]
MKSAYDKLRPEQLQLIQRLTSMLAARTDEEDILDAMLSELMQETSAEVGAFVHYDAVQDSFTPRKCKTLPPQDPSAVAFSQTVFRRVVESRDAVLSFDVQAEEDYQARQSVVLNEIHAVLAFPLIIQGRVYGIVYFDSRRSRQRFNESTCQFLSLFAPIASLALEQMLRSQEIKRENVVLRHQMARVFQIPAIVGESPPMQRLFELISKVSAADVPVIIMGENGTGKDLVAQAIHNLSARKDKPFLAQYIGNIPATILESELFGYKRGAFTGAHTDKIGIFEAVNGGTLFLDEIGELSIELQIKLLRVLQNQEIKRLGENTVRRVDVRILAATNKDLVALVKSGQFREDLYYRLNVISIVVPPLRERKADIPLLLNHFLQRQKSGRQLRFSPAALKKLMAYDWPGNVRQLENIVKRAAVLANGEVIESDDIQFDELEPPFTGTLEEYKNKLILARLQEFKGNKTRAARSLGISLRSLQAKAKELGF